MLLFCTMQNDIINTMQKRPLTPQKIVFNCNVLIVRTINRKDITTTQKAQLWHKLRQVKQLYK